MGCTVLSISNSVIIVKVDRMRKAKQYDCHVIEIKITCAQFVSWLSMEPAVQSCSDLQYTHLVRTDCTFKAILSANL